MECKFSKGRKKHEGVVRVRLEGQGYQKVGALNILGQ